MSDNTNLNHAKQNKNDEFYTFYEDVEKEVSLYTASLKGKRVYCNCDNPERSSFFRYFVDNFNVLGIKSLTATYYTIPGEAYAIEYTGEKNHYALTPLEGDGSFDSKECVDILQKSDVIITNPPFSRFRDLFQLITDNDKQFLLVCNLNTLTDKTIFPYIKGNKIWTGYHYIKQFDSAFGIRKFGNVVWITNLPVYKDNHINLTKTYNPSDYPRYDNFDAIEVGKVKDIPKDYKGLMGVPVSFLMKYSPYQFEIKGELNHGSDGEYDFAKPIVRGRQKYARLVIQFKSPDIYPAVLSRG